LNDIVIVGSGGSLINSNLGSKIDSFENVARFGGSEVHLQKYKTDVGEKTTHLFYNTSKQGCKMLARYAEENPDFYSNLKLYICFQKTKTPAFKNLWPVTKRILNKHDIEYETHWIPAHIRLPKRGADGISFPAELIKFNSGGRYNNKGISRHITTGLSAITKFLHKYDNIYLCGFDTLVQGPSRNYRRFYDEKPTNRLVAKCHSMRKEVQVIHYLADKYKKIHILESEG
tara:strand:+ start:968 stop:1657 length:690 start_codon:yes stop_codon:yes gene_type:complete